MVTTVHSAVSYVLGPTDNDLVLTGSADVNGTGNALANSITGNSGNNILNGGTGADTLIGGDGNDTYIVDNVGDVVTETDATVAGGVDTVQSSVSFTLGANVENLTLTGTGNINGTGNALANTITGNSGNNILNGGAGADTMVGGQGNDTYVVDNIGDVVTENASQGTDTVDVNIVATGGTYTLGANIENGVLVNTVAFNLTGNTLDNMLTGNAAANILTGGAGNDTLDGGAGADTLVGGLGNDTYVVDNIGDVVTENPGEGTDTVKVNIATAGGTYSLGSDVENATLISSVAYNLTGNTLNNVLTGNAAANMLNGGTGADTMIGGDGNDTYIVDNTGDVVTETDPALAGGIDTVLSSVSFTLGVNVENLTLTGTGNINATGNALNNLITGNAGNNILNGGIGIDTMEGGLGDDTYVVDNIGDVVTETSASGGTDTVLSSITYTLGANLENLTLTGTFAINGTGNSLNNIIIGNTGNNILDGGTGADTLVGGAGNDTYLVDNVNDVVTENPGEGIDTVKVGIATAGGSYTLGSNIENGTLTNTIAFHLIGNELDNVLTSNAAVDTLVGGLGDDTYVINNAADVVTENPGEGTDTVKVNIATAGGIYTLGSDVENATLINTVAYNLTGNALDNVLSGNTMANVLNGGLGADTMTGGDGNDTYVVDNIGDVVNETNPAISGGIDTVQASISYTLTANVENLTLTGTADINGTGNALNNLITGNQGNNILDGGVGVDTLVGGNGNDTYIVDNAGDVVTESNALAAGGIDLVQSSVSYTLGANLENLTLTGTTGINGTGNTLANIITGNDANNILDGGAGADTLVGGLGNDTYVVDNIGDVVTENPGEGTDTVKVNIATAGGTYTLGSNIENGTLINAVAYNLTGNDLDNVLIGNALANTLHGGIGNDTLDGGAGADTMIGGLGDDTYVVDNVNDVVTENPGEGIDTVKVGIATVGGSYTLGNNIENGTLTGLIAYNLNGNALDNVLTGNAASNVLNGGAGADTMIGGDGSDTYVVDNAGDVVIETDSQSAGGVDTVQSSVSYTLGANLENLTLTGMLGNNGTGNGLANVITGNAGANILDGGAGADTMIGGDGNDTYIVDNVGDVVTETNALPAGGIDTVQSAVTFTLGANIENLILTGNFNTNGTGNALNNNITGNTGNNVLDGGAGADTMTGGTGDDTYVVDNIGDVVIENPGEGTDMVKVNIATAGGTYTLGSDIENGMLINSVAYNLTGNGLDNVLTGNAAANVLNGGAGNDTLSGGAGADTMIGGVGDDTYVVDNLGDVVTEGAGAGTDTVNVNIVTPGGTYVLGNNIENGTLVSAITYNLTGNALDNVLIGNAAANVLNGGMGADTMAGGLGNDTYVVDNAGDVVTENFNEGTDLVQSSISYTLGANLENLTLTGIGNIDGTGNAFSNLITGNAGANILDGGLGGDTLVGGDGNDTYIVDNVGDIVIETDALAAGGIDTVQSAVSFVLGANLENLTLTGTANVNGTGNTLNNIIIGNAGNNVLDGGAGIDTMTGGMGDDTYVVDNVNDVVVESPGEGTDTVKINIAAAGGTYTLGSNIENGTLINAVAYNLTGNSLDNVLIGNALANTLNGGIGNDTLNGGAGADTMIGGAGDDTYVVDNIGDVVTEGSAAGTDTVNVNIATAGGTYALGANIENATLISTVAYNLTGNGLDNVLTGNAAANVLNGGAGADTMIGGDGSDTYIVDNASDVVIETNAAASGGIDTVVSSFSYTLGTDLENLTLTGNSSIDGTGNSLNNVITGNAGANILDGGTGADTMMGGDGNDTYIVDSSSDVVIEANALASGGVDIVLSSASFALGANIENLTLTGTGNINGTGNALNNTITGNTGSNVLDGGAGADTLVGGDGNDTYIVDNINDVVIENSGEGIDTVKVNIATAGGTYGLGTNIENGTLINAVAYNLTGNNLNNVLTGNAMANILNGGIGADTMIGGDGNDTYIVDNSGDVVTETNALAAGGIDTVQSSLTYKLGSNLENLTLTGSGSIDGTGNTLNNVIVGNSGDNTLDGGTGADTLMGGDGNDTYIVDNSGDVVTESDALAAGGIDTVLSSVSFALGANIENLTLTGTASINGSGNGLANVITGNAGANILNGGAGADTMIGGLGNDTYVVDNIGDVVTEAAAAGTDTVDVNIATAGGSYTLGANIENGTLTNTVAYNLTGNSLDNVLTSNATVDTLIGGLGNDTYVVNNINDVVTEGSAAGTDTVKVNIATAGGTYTLGANIENGTLTNSVAFNLTGNALNNVLTGNGAANVLTGGGGADTFVFNTAPSAANIDTITDFTSGTDILQLSHSVFSAATIGTLSASDFVSSNTAAGAVAHDATDHFIYNSSTGALYYDADGSGAGAKVQVATLGTTTHPALTAADIHVA